MELNTFCHSQKPPLVNHHLLSSYLTVLWQPVCGLCFSQAVVLFFQYLVGHSGAILTLQEESRPLLTTALHTATFSYRDAVPSLYMLCFNKYLKILNSWTGFRSIEFDSI